MQEINKIRENIESMEKFINGLSKDEYCHYQMQHEEILIRNLKEALNLYESIV